MISIDEMNCIKSTVTVDNIANGLSTFIEKEVIPEFNLPSWQRIIVGTAIGLCIKKKANLYKKFIKDGTFTMAGVVNEFGNVNLDDLITEVKKNIPNEGLTVKLPILGNKTFTSDDIDKIYLYIKCSRLDALRKSGMDI